MIVKKSNAVICVVAVAVVSYLLGSFLGLPFVDSDSASGDIGKSHVLDNALVTGKVPKKLKTLTPFWGLPHPLSGAVEEYNTLGDCTYFRKSENVFPNWITWNLNLATGGAERYKFDDFVPAGQTIPCRDLLCAAVDECYRWAWRKPYGNTNVVVGPVFNPKTPQTPSAYFVAVCKKERLDVPMPLDFTSMGYLIPVNAKDTNIHDYSLSVNALEYRTGYNLFADLPGSVQEMVEEITEYELAFASMDYDQAAAESFMPEMEREDHTEDPRRDCE